MITIQRLISQYPLRFLLFISAFIIQLLPNLISSWLERIVGETSTQILKIIAFVIAVLLAVYVLVKIIERMTTHKLTLVTREQEPPRFKGLVLLIGPGRQNEDPLKGPAVPAIEFHKPQVLWLLPSRQGVPVANLLREKYEKQMKVITTIVNNPWDVQDTYREVKIIYATAPEAYGLPPENIIADITGGTHPMAAGMVLACQDERNMQYMSGKPDTVSRPIWIHFTPEPQPGTANPAEESA